VTIPGSGEKPDPSPPSPNTAPEDLRQQIVEKLREMGWSVSSAADMGLSTTVLINEEMYGASVDLSDLYQAAAQNFSARPPLKVFAFSVTTEQEIAVTPGTTVRSGSPTVTVERHLGLGLLGCGSEVSTDGTDEEVVSATIAALAATVEQFRLLTL
jgi:hypothetical protein